MAWAVSDGHKAGSPKQRSASHSRWRSNRPTRCTGVTWASPCATLATSRRQSRPSRSPPAWTLITNQPGTNGQTSWLTAAVRTRPYRSMITQSVWSRRVPYSIIIAASACAYLVTSKKPRRISYVAFNGIQATSIPLTNSIGYKTTASRVHHGQMALQAGPPPDLRPHMPEIQHRRISHHRPRRNRHDHLFRYRTKIRSEMHR